MAVSVQSWVIYDYLGNDTRLNLFSNKNNKQTYIMFHFFIYSLYINRITVYFPKAGKLKGGFLKISREMTVLFSLNWTNSALKTLRYFNINNP